ncbi:hypothetical protein [Neorhizobium galegae]|uniref:hypothetical protein n=1 Tax=Neorhizobium galegae TaxID=399 RepID=UPI0006219767|nr:hypothetical protein [Neorhizobium galegae]CDZ29372.1 Hypothetical protein NGAL_HAMBI490_42380 [Neorhizobium galegae bv. officinalis]KAA9386438.1 hypothetical protein F4V88_08125 [Neorhizobium galegae]KAB1112707.1 hypothetical protein F4V89_14840 [Neorhizobium galegae]MCM2500638.1 hypothetical protein [Neorhizobium galegae]MCQ1764669.1 hypothetical protein [Neorhizobium galegae]
MTELPVLEFPLIPKGLSAEDTLSVLRKEKTNFVVSAGADGLRVISQQGVGTPVPPPLLEDRSGILAQIQSLPSDVPLSDYLRSNSALWNFSRPGMVSIRENLVQPFGAERPVAIFGYDSGLGPSSSSLLGLFDKHDVYKIVAGIWECPYDGELFRADGTCPVHGRRLKRKA